MLKSRNLYHVNIIIIKLNFHDYVFLKLLKALLRNDVVLRVSVFIN